MFLFLIIYKLIVMVVGIFFIDKMGFVINRKKIWSIKVFKGKYMYLLLICLKFLIIFEKESCYY